MAIKSLLTVKGISFATAVIIAVGGIGYALTKDDNNVQVKKPQATTNDNSTANGAGQASKPSDSKGSNSGSQTTPIFSGTLVAPTGQFVSNHHPNLSGSPAPNTEQSACNTSPGANCDISFTKGSVTKSLGTKIADSQGLVIWNWKLQDVELSEGNWKIAATASGGGQTKTATDVQDLSIGP
jgi:hypothetical protein